MSVYSMDDGTVVDTDLSSQKWDENTYWDGNNMCSSATQSQWNHQTLYRSRKGRYYIEHTSAYQGTNFWCEWITRRDAAGWLLSQDLSLPDDLLDLVEEIVE